MSIGQIIQLTSIYHLFQLHVLHSLLKIYTRSQTFRYRTYPREIWLIVLIQFHDMCTFASSVSSRT